MTVIETQQSMDELYRDEATRYSAAEAAEWCHVSKPTIYRRALKSGIGTEDHNGQRRFSSADLERLDGVKDGEMGTQELLHELDTEGLVKDPAKMEPGFRWVMFRRMVCKYDGTRCGEPIPHSKFFRQFCATCHEPIRVEKDRAHLHGQCVCNQCEGTYRNHHDGRRTSAPDDYCGVLA